MVNIVIGINGFGQGHSARQSKIIDFLLDRGHKISLLVHDSSYDFFKDRCNVYNTAPPWLSGGSNGLNYEDISTNPINQKSNFFNVNFSAMDSIVKEMGTIDLIISDYEPISAMLSYSLSVPLITIDQQSKFLGYEFDDILFLSRLEEKARLGMFFPKTIKRISASFYKLDDSKKDPDYDVTIVPPILREEIKNIKPSVKKNNVVVYLSPYGEFTHSHDEIKTILSKIKNKNFYIFNKTTEKKDGNIQFLKFSNERFIKEITKCEAVISTAGHTLISELMYLGKPIYAIPFNTFDQHYCAKIIQENKLGVWCDKLDIEQIKYFFENISLFRDNIKTSNAIYHNFDGDLEIFKMLEDIEYV